MTGRYLDTQFSAPVLAAQEAAGAAGAYGRLLGQAEGPDRFTRTETAFIRARDSFYMASINANGWPYLQHRGGPIGFVKVLDEHRFGIADYRGNRQYISLGNVSHDDRVALFFMDYARRQRLKVLAHMTPVDLAEEPDLAAALIDRDYGAKIERGFVFTLEAFDWNCPQHITRRWTEDEVAAVVTAQEDKIARLEAELAEARAD